MYGSDAGQHVRSLYTKGLSPLSGDRSMSGNYLCNCIIPEVSWHLAALSRSFLEFLYHALPVDS